MLHQAQDQSGSGEPMKRLARFHQYRQIRGFIVALMLVEFVFACEDGVKTANAGPGRVTLLQDEPSPVAHLFGHEVLTDNVVATRLKASQMPAESRYEFLQNWVIHPQTDHIRLFGKLIPPACCDSDVAAM